MENGQDKKIGVTIQDIANLYGFVCRGTCPMTGDEMEAFTISKIRVREFLKAQEEAMKAKAEEESSGPDEAEKPEEVGAES